MAEKQITVTSPLMPSLEENLMSIWKTFGNENGLQTTDIIIKSLKKPFVNILEFHI